MRAIVIAMLAASGIAFGGASNAAAAPVGGATLARDAAVPALVVKARAYCYRHYTYTSRRRFLYWGSCGSGEGRQGHK
jgi:hypothetical protein